MNTKHLLLSLLALLGSTTLHAYDAYIGGIYYNFSGDKATVTYQIYQSSNPYYISDYTGAVAIPESVTYNGKTYIVTSIGHHAFYCCGKLTSITIPNSVTSIGNLAFYGCSGLTSITIPNSVTSIGNSAFESCSGLTSITIPNSVTSIGESAFQGCSGLTSFTIPNVLTTISPGTFRDCSGLTSIIIPESVTSISWGAFTDCSSLADITFPSNLSYIDFSDDDSEFVFDGTAWYDNQPDGMVYAGNVAYRYKGSMPANTNITLRDGTLGIGAGAFDNYTEPSTVNLSSITIPASVTTIGDYAFYGCSGLTSVVSKIKEPFNLRAGAFEGISSNCVLTVPKGKISAYNDAGWTESVFQGGVVEETEVEIGPSGYATYSSTRDLDFSGVSGLRAYIASGFSPSTGRLVLTRVDEVPAGEGLYIVGDPGTYEIPTTTTDMLYSNFLKGVTTTTTIYPTEGSYTNFILSTGSHGVGFYTLSSSGELAAGKAYLQLPTASVPNVKAIRLAFDDDDPTALQNIEDYTTAEDIYNLQGQKVSAPRSGLYIINGKKILFK